jgi:hypothetical protein
MEFSIILYVSLNITFLLAHNIVNSFELLKTNVGVPLCTFRHEAAWMLSGNTTQLTVNFGAGEIGKTIFTKRAQILWESHLYKFPDFLSYTYKQLNLYN